jgi:hypothetical protein
MPKTKPLSSQQNKTIRGCQTVTNKINHDIICTPLYHYM